MKIRTSPTLLIAIGLFVFINYPAEAAKKIKNKDIAKNAAISYSKLDLHGSVDSGDIQNGSIEAEDLARDSVTSSKIKDGTITAEDIASSAITSDEILNGEVITDDLANSSVTSAKIADSTITVSDIADSAITTAKLLDGTIAAADLASDSVTTAKILDDTITVSDIATDGVDSAEIKADAVTASEIATDAVDSAEIKADAVDSAEVKADAVTASEIATSGVATAELLNGTIINEDVGAAAAIAYSKLNLADSIVTGDITNGTIANADIADGASVAYSKLNLANSIVTGDITDGTIANGDISGSAAIAYSKLNLASSIVTGDITNGTITGSDLANDVILAGDFTVSGGDLYITPEATSASTTEGTVYYDSDDDNLYVYANGGWVDLTAGAAGAVTLDDAYNTSAGASTVLVDAGNLTLRSGAASSLGDIIVDLNSTGDFLIKDANVTYASFGDDETIVLGNNAGTIAINSNDWDIDATGAITGASFDANGSGNSITNIESADIAADTITTDDVAADTIAAGDIASNAVDSAEINANAVGTSEIADGTVAGGDLAANIAISTTGSVATTGAGTITSAGAIAANGGVTTDGGDDLGALASRWSTIYADTLNFKDTLTDVATNSAVSFGDSANATMTFGDSATLDTLSVTANAAITDGQWSVSNVGAAVFASATVGGNNVVTVGDNGTVTSTMITDGTIAGGDLAAAIAITTSGATSFTGNVTLGSGNDDTIGIDANNWDITSAGAATLVDLTATGTTTLGNAATDTIGLEGDITIGNGAGDDISVNSATWDVSTAGAATGLTGVTSTGNIDLTGATYIRVINAASGEACAAGSKGSIYYDTDDNHFYGCNGTTYVQLDN